MKRRFPLWPVIVIGMLSSVAVLNVIVYVAASRAPGELIDARPYESSMSYEQKVQTLRAANELEIGISLEAGPADAAGTRRIEAAVSGAQPPLPQTLTLEALRPSSSALDTKAEMVREDGPKFAARIPLASGLWLFRIRGVFSGRDVLVEQQQILP